jgi:glutamine amidotransferase
MGWNSIHVDTLDHPLLRGIADGSFVYFAHSYAAAMRDCTIATAEYAYRFTAIVAQNNFFGCQFHPERSGPTGLKLIENFLGL